METTDNIVERLPTFYRAREKDSSFYQLIDGISFLIGEQKEALVRIRDSHWLDYAGGINLDLLASILSLGRKRKETDEDFRLRIRNTITNLSKGGTVEAIRIQLGQYLATSKEDITLIENPPTEMQIERKVVSGDTWAISSSSIKDEKAAIVLSLEEGEAKDPTIIDTGANSAIIYKGTLKKGDTLEISQGKASLNGSDVTPSLSVEYGDPKPSSSHAEDIPIISRKPSKWLFKERLTDTHARFDQSRFDDGVFFKFVPPTIIRIKWVANLLSAFEVRIPSKVLEKSGLTREEIELLVNAIKAAGIRTSVTIMPNTDEPSVVEEKPSTLKKPGRAAGR